MCILVIMGATLETVDCIGCHVCSETDSIFRDREALLVIILHSCLCVNLLCVFVQKKKKKLIDLENVISCDLIFWISRFKVP